MKTWLELCQEVHVMYPGEWENELSNSIIKDWYALVDDDKGIVAYFGDELEALSARTDYLMRRKNEVSNN